MNLDNQILLFLTATASILGVAVLLASVFFYNSVFKYKTYKVKNSYGKITNLEKCFLIFDSSFGDQIFQVYEMKEGNYTIYKKRKGISSIEIFTVENKIDIINSTNRKSTKKLLMEKLLFDD